MITEGAPGTVPERYSAQRVPKSLVEGESGWRQSVGSSPRVLEMSHPDTANPSADPTKALRSFGMVVRLSGEGIDYLNPRDDLPVIEVFAQ